MGRGYHFLQDPRNIIAYLLFYTHVQNSQIMEIILKRKKPKSETDTTTKKSSGRATVCLELSTKWLHRRAFSEVSMLDACGKFDFKEGMSYNFITGGDVDALTYLKAILRQQDIEYVLFSTWCMSAQDILQIKQWLEQGKIKNLDCFVGEIFPTSYRVELGMLQEMYASGLCGSGRLVIFKNHSKIFAGYGDKFHFGIQSSANINTNPRTEQGVITISKEIYEFYKSFFDEIESFKYGTDTNPRLNQSA